jgi:hypothetical protein
MKCIVQNNRIVLTFSDTADFSNWPTVNDGGQISIVSNVPDYLVVSAVIPDGTPVTELVFADGAVTVRVPSDAEVAATKAAQRAAIQAEIDFIERSTLLNRGSREFELVSCQDLAARKAVILQPSMPDKTLDEIAALVLGSNVYYGKLVALNTQVTALRNAMAAI